MIDQRPRRIRTRIYGTMAVVAALLLGYWWFSDSRFDSAAWKSVSGNDASKLTMVDDLLAQYQLVGMERAEIDELLGVAPDTPYFADFDYVYWLGPERGFISIDSEWLCIDFTNDVVVDARLMRD